MGQKIHPIGFRVGVIRDWESRWYATKEMGALIAEDAAIRKFVKKKLAQAAVSRIEIERSPNRVKALIHTAKPGLIIGRGGRGVDELRDQIQKISVGKQVHVAVEEIRQPELDAQLVAESIALQIERRISHKRAMKQTITRTMRMGAKGIKIRCAGRLGGAEMARVEVDRSGKIPLQTLRADIDYGFAEAKTTYGHIGIKVWIYKGEVLPGQRRAEPTEEQLLEIRRREMRERGERRRGRDGDGAQRGERGPRGGGRGGAGGGRGGSRGGGGRSGGGQRGGSR
ncbi:MAG: 30S ribosomal protein S3 [Armatimonadota bacterium]